MNREAPAAAGDTTAFGAGGASSATAGGFGSIGLSSQPGRRRRGPDPYNRFSAVPEMHCALAGGRFEATVEYTNPATGLIATRPSVAWHRQHRVRDLLLAGQRRTGNQGARWPGVQRCLLGVRNWTHGCGLRDHGERHLGWGSEDIQQPGCRDSSALSRTWMPFRNRGPGLAAATKTASARPDALANTGKP